MLKELTFNINEDNINKIKDITKYFDGYDNEISIFNGEYKADWLLNGIHSIVWIIKTPRTFKDKDGTFKYIKKIRWDRPLPDGSLFSDECNTSLRELIQKMTFICHESPIINHRNTTQTVSNASTQTCVIISWLVLNKDKLQLKNKSLSQLTQAWLEEFVIKMIYGGVFELLNTGQRIIAIIENKIKKPISYRNIFNISKENKNAIIKYLNYQDLYKTNCRGRIIINRPALCESLGISQHELYSHHATLFLRQFEPDLITYNDKVLVPIKLKTEFPSHRTPLISEIENKTYTSNYVKQYLLIINDWLKLKDIFTKELPNPDVFRFNKLRQLLNSHGKSNNVTPWIPFHISMRLFKESINLVVDYGDEILDFYEECEHYFMKTGSTGKLHTRERNEYVINNCPERLKELNIQSFSNNKNYQYIEGSPNNRYERLRKNPSLKDMVQILQGACIILVAGFKPIRVNELCDLRYDCIYYKEGDGFWIQHKISKSGIKNISPEDKKPIPRISAIAVKHLQKLNNIARHCSPNDENSYKYLFYSLSYNRTDSYASIKTSAEIGSCIELFTDYIDLPVDAYGRRWYVNIHELRKSFLLTFFWTYKFSSLDSCRWIAGHKDPDHIFRYIEANMPGEEMVEIEAEYATYQLMLFNSDHGIPEMENIISLNDDVCEHFNVTNTSEIEKDELNEWIELSMKSGKYKIEAFDIESIDESLNTRIAFRVNKNK